MSSNDDLQRALQVTLAARTRHAMYTGTELLMVETFEMAALLGIPFVRSLAEVSDEGGTAELDDLGMREARQELLCDEDTLPSTPYSK